MLSGTNEGKNSQRKLSVGKVQAVSDCFWWEQSGEQNKYPYRKLCGALHLSAVSAIMITPIIREVIHFIL
jgi:hypothetical protein